MTENYEMIVGLEVHAELNTKTKIFCSCKTEFGAEPNTQCCPVCMGLPGVLPTLNKEVIKKAVKAGLATNSEISTFSKLDRKNYFYPDLPKAYQISQYDIPLCKNGYINISLPQGEKKIGISRIHIEEDAGKIINTDNKLLCDYNRAGVPLIEIVSEPDIRSSEEASAYLKTLRKILVYIDVSDCKMEEGSLRCDVNISVRKKGDSSFNTRCEIKNLNSFQFVEKAIEYEYKRQIEIINSGGQIAQETRGYNVKEDKTYLMRKKENSEDYRYFPEPDLQPVILSDDYIKEIKNKLPILPQERKKKYMNEYALSEDDAEILTSDINLSDYFEECVKIKNHPKILANLIIDKIRNLMGENKKIPILPLYTVKTADYLYMEKINNSTAKKVIATMWENNKDPEEIIEGNNMWQINDEKYLADIIVKIINDNPKAVKDYNNGKENALKTIVGMAIKETDGKGNPGIISELAKKLIII